MGCSTYLGLGWRYQPLAPGHPTSICDIGVNFSFNQGSVSEIILRHLYPSYVFKGEVSCKFAVISKPKNVCSSAETMK